MEKIKANNYANAKKQAVEFENDNQIKSGLIVGAMPKEIEKVSSASHYHVLLISLRHSPKLKRYVVQSRIQTFSKGPAFEKIAKNFNSQGFDILIILHDPRQEKDDTTSQLKGHEKTSIKYQVQKEEKAAMEKRVKERIEALEAIVIGKQVAGMVKQNIESLGKDITVDNIISIAKENGIDLTKAKTTEQKFLTVNKWVNDKLNA